MNDVQWNLIWLVVLVHVVIVATGVAWEDVKKGYATSFWRLCATYSLLAMWTLGVLYVFATGVRCLVGL